MTTPPPRRPRPYAPGSNTQRRNRRNKWSATRKAFFVFIILAALIGGIAACNALTDDEKPQPNDDTSESATPDAAPGQSATVDNADDIEKLTSVTVHTKDGDKTFDVIGKPVAWSKINNEAAKRIAKEHCPDGYVFTGNTAPANSFDEDPEVETAQEGMDYIQKQVVCDASYLAGFNTFNDKEAMMTASEADAYAQRIFADTSEWAKAVNKTNEDVKFVALVDVQVPAETLGAIPAADANEPWKYTKWGDRPVVGKAMAVVLMNGETRIYREGCGGQMTVLEFVKIPPPAQVIPVQPSGPPPAACIGCGVDIVPPPPVCTTCECLGTCPPPPPVCTTCECLGTCPEPGKIPANDPYQRGNAPQGGGPRSGPLREEDFRTPEQMEQHRPPSTPYAPPPPPPAVVVPENEGGPAPEPTPAPPPPVDPGATPATGSEGTVTEPDTGEVIVDGEVGGI